MKEIEAFESALKHSITETTRAMSGQLRNEARASGWPSHVVRNMKVKYGKDGFETHVHDAHRELAHDLEYGTSSTEPTAAVRRFGNRTHEAEKFLVGRMSERLKHL